MKAHSALVWPKRVVKLNTVTVVHLYIVIVIQPLDPKTDLPVWIDKPFDDIVFKIFWVLFDERFDRDKYLFNGLKKRSITLAVTCFC